MIFINRIITVSKGNSKINEPIVAYRGDYELEVRFTILNSTFNFIETENAAFGQLAVLTPYGGNIFSSISECDEGSISFLLSKDMLDQIEEVGLYSFQIRLFDQNKQSRISIPPVEYGIEVREPITSEDHDNTINNSIVGYSIAKIVNPTSEIIGNTFDVNGQYNKTNWKTGDRITQGKLNKIEDALDTINKNEKNDVETISKRVTTNYNVLNSNKADKDETNKKINELATAGTTLETIQTKVQNMAQQGLIQAYTLGDNTIEPRKTTFFGVDKEISLFDGAYHNIKVTGYPNLKVEDGDISSKTAIVKIEPNTTYSIIKDKVSRFNYGTTTHLLNVNDRELLDGSVIKPLGNSDLPYSTFTSGDNDEYLYVNVTIDAEDIFMQIVEGVQQELTINEYPIIPKSVSIYSKKEIDKKIDDLVITPDKTTFFKEKIINLFDGKSIFYDTKIAGAVPSMNLKENVGSRTAWLKIKPNTTYSVIKEQLSGLIEHDKNYFKIMTSSELYPYGSVTDGWAEGRNLNNIYHRTYCTFTSGENDNYLYIYYTDTNEDCFIQVVEGIQDVFTASSHSEIIINPKQNLNIYNKNEVDNLISQQPYNRDIIVRKENNDLHIYIPSKTSTNFIRYWYKRVDDDSINMHQWRVQKTYLVDNRFNVLFDFDGHTEWEGAIRENGASDFMGGYHGDENNVFLSVMLDGVEIDIHGEDFETQVKNEVRIVNKSLLNRCDTPNDNVFERYKVNIWNKENYIVENKYIALQQINISSSKVCLMSMKYDFNGKELVSFGRYDYDYLVTDLTKPFKNVGCGISRKNVKRMEIWGETSGVYTRLECEYDYAKYPNRYQYIEDFRDQNRCKCYFDLTGSYTMAEGEELICKSTFTITG